MNEKFDPKKVHEALQRTEQKLADASGTSVEEVRASMAEGAGTAGSKDVATAPAPEDLVKEVVAQPTEDEQLDPESKDLDVLAQEAATEVGAMDLSNIVAADVTPVVAAAPRSAPPVREAPLVSATPKKEPVPTKASKNILDSLVVDLEHFDIIDANVIDETQFTNAALDSDASYQVICLRSGFSGSMTSLNFKDKDRIRNSNLDAFNERKMIYSIAHTKMSSSSVGKMSFAEFLKITAYSDIDTLMFGIFCQTYPGNTEFTINCGNCQFPINTSINPQAFIQIKDNDVFAYVDEILSNQHAPLELLGKSLVHTTRRIILPKSKLIIYIKTPSLQDHLNLLSHYNAASMANLRETIGIMTYIDKLYYPNMAAIKASGRPVYSELKEFGKKLDVVYRLKDGDDDFLNGEINKREEKHNVSYRLKEMECPQCKHNIKDMDIDIERLLFYQMEETRKNSMKGKATT